MKKKFKSNFFNIRSNCGKVCLIMRLTLVLMAASLMQIYATGYTQSARISLSLKNVSLKQALKEIEKQSNYTFVYNDSKIDVNKKVDINVKDCALVEVLDQLIADSEINYTSIQNHIVLTDKNKYIYRLPALTREAVLNREELAMETISPIKNYLLQQITVTGKIVSSADGQPLPGVNVVVKGTTIGSTSDINGAFTLNIPDPNSTLVFSFVGYQTKEVVLAGQKELDITLVEETQELQEIVVVGYGVRKKSLVTGAISSVRSEDIANSNISRAEQALQGRTSGVIIIPQSGAPGAGMNVRIRGVGSNANSNPIYIVDGTKTGDINYLDPGDIQSMEILKDAASSAIYGAEGGNGVVIITTKQGVAGKTKITYDFQHGVLQAAKLPELMNTKQYVEFMTDKNSNGSSILSGAVDSNYDTDWLDEIFETGRMTKHNLSFSGGNEKSTFLLGLSYLNNNGIVVGNKDVFNRYSVRFNSSHKITSWLKVGNNIAYSHFKTKGINENSGEFGGMIGSALQLDPTTPVEYTDPSLIPAFVQGEINAHKKDILSSPNGNYWGISQYVGGEITNPFVTQYLTNGVVTNDKLMGNVYAEITPFKDFTFTSRLGLDLALNNNHFWFPAYYYNATNQRTSAYPQDNNDYYNTWIWENFGSYAKKIDKHSFTLMAGMSAQRYLHRNINGIGSSMIYPMDKFAQLSFTDHSNDNVTGTVRETLQTSYFGRFNYEFNDKYLIEGVIRRDGAGESQVPSSGRWGVFPSISAGWVFTNESFFPKTILSYGKLRASWGQNGSIASLDENNLYAYIASITSTNGGQPLNYPLSNGTYAPAAEPQRLNNPDLTWETSEQTDIGLDLRAFNDRLSFTVDYYNKVTKDLIFTGIPPATSGNAPARANGGNVENKGFEFELGYKNSVGDFKYAINLNLTTLKNTVTYLAPEYGSRVAGASVGTGWSPATVFEKGNSIWNFFGYKTNGIDPATGNPVFVTAAGNDTSAMYIQDKDKQDLGSALPKLIYGGNIYVAYKGLDLNVNFVGQQGNKVAMGWVRTDKLASNRVTHFYEDRWRNPGDVVDMPSANPAAQTYASDLFIFNASFFRIQSINLGYTIPASITEKAKISNLRVFVSLNNYFTFTKYPGMDPQPTVQNNNANNIGIDRGTYPMAKDITFGASISF